MEIKEFYDLCKNHDWYCDYSDDQRRWKAGTANMDNLIKLSKGNEIFEKILKDFGDFYFKGKARGNKPKLEDYIGGSECQK
jgi:hypothetical protein